MIRDHLYLAQCSFSTPFLASSVISSAIYGSCKYIDYPLLSLISLWDWAHQTLVLRKYPKQSQSARSSLNVALPMPSAVSKIPLQILISLRKGSTEVLVIASLKSPRSAKLQKDKFQSEQHSEDFLTGMPSTLQSTQTSLPPASSELVVQVTHRHQRGAQLAHHHYHLKEGFQVCRGQVPLHHYLSSF